MKCPNCGEQCERDMVDVGVGEMPSGPYGCENCGWVDRQTDEMFREPLIDDPRMPHGSMVRERDVDYMVDRIADAFTCDEDNRPSRDDDFD